MNAFRALLDSGEPALFDGATGTELYRRGIFINRCFEEANLNAKDMVLGLHRDYAAAGARILTTNSWGAGPFKLRAHNLQGEVTRINAEAARLAVEASAGRCLVAGSVGPLGLRLEPFGQLTAAEATAAFGTSMRGLAEGGADFFLLETFSEVQEALLAIAAAKAVAPELPVAVCLTVGFSGQLAMGPDLAEAFGMLEAAGAAAVGLNCSVGPQPLLTTVKAVLPAVRVPFIVQPNAGLPREVDGRTIYLSTPEYFASCTRHFLQEGVRLVGGCCGTSPEHIRAMAQSLRQFRAMEASGERPVGLATAGGPAHPGRAAEGTNQEATAAAEARNPGVRVSVVASAGTVTGNHGAAPAVAAAAPVTEVPFAQKSAWSAKLSRGEAVASIELLPPAGIDPAQLLERARQAKAAGIDAINIPDGPRASSRMSTIVTAILIEQKIGIETILHYTCRDRNLIGMQADMLGAHAIGLRNILAITGDPPKLGDYPNATGVFDIDSIGLTKMIRRLDAGCDVAGRSIGSPTALSCGVGVNPVHRDFEYEMARFVRKVEAGAEWAITQPVFDPRSLERLLEVCRREGIRIPIIMGIWPLTSLRNAQFMRNEMPGVEIPDSVMERMAKAATPAEARAEGVAIARELYRSLRSAVQGVQLSAPFGKLELALQVIAPDSGSLVSGVADCGSLQSAAPEA